ncbi:Inner membrane protein YqaA [Jannaschia seosinensis]|uniref:Inner membrane protein YqaA n=1 Tax=Jannaschia seosinensis TaxID=313367 RepID=A0A0M7BE69_9RHOB|nr:YqaA family protein [Jannaschia seosinensis]CUH41020.1 Inner membrane protein YqaA [Jannaschia seosinensis]
MEHSAVALLMGSAFLSATLLPGTSEAVLIGLLVSGQGAVLPLVVAASIGNVAGSIVNWLLGRFFSRYSERAWFPVKREAILRAQRWFERYGFWSLLLSWVPIIGDPLTLVAGLMRISFLRFLILVTIGKTLRYVLVVSLWQQMPQL